MTLAEMMYKVARHHGSGQLKSTRQPTQAELDELFTDAPTPRPLELNDYDEARDLQLTKEVDVLNY